jgi:hypothetical protein
MTTPLRDVRDRDGNPIDPDLVALLESEGAMTLEEARDRGRDHWVGVVATADGFERDFDQLLSDLGLTWSEAATAEHLQQSIWDFEIGVGTTSVLQKNGVETFGDAFTRDRAFWREQLGTRNGWVAELERLLGENGLAW